MRPGPRASATIIIALVGSALSATAADGSTEQRPPTCQGRSATLVGGDAADRLVGSSRRDVIVAGRGNDLIAGRGGADRICAGGGSDLIRGGRGGDLIRGGPDDDRVGYESVRQGVRVDLRRGRTFGQGRDRLVSVNGVNGSRFADRIRGGDGSNLIYARPGDDLISGGRGNDYLVGGAGADRLVDRRGSNTLLGYVGADTVAAGPHDGGWLDGGRSRDRL